MLRHVLFMHLNSYLCVWNWIKSLFFIHLVGIASRGLRSELIGTLFHPRCCQFSPNSHHSVGFASKVFLITRVESMIGHGGTCTWEKHRSNRVLVSHFADRFLQANRLHHHHPHHNCYHQHHHHNNFDHHHHYLIGQIELCKHIVINSCSCRGYLSKQGTRLKGWNRWRWLWLWLWGWG